MHYLTLLFWSMAEDGRIVAVRRPDTVADVDVAEAVAESMEILMSKEDEKNAKS